MKRVRFQIEGMGCPGCARKIAFFLEQAGAQGVMVSRETGEAVAQVPEGVDPHELAALIESVGHYQVVAVEELSA